jgi:hypothetical protein
MSLTVEDLIESREAILAVVKEGFAGVHRRQDVTNGRVGKIEDEIDKLEVQAGRQDERIRNIGKEVFNRRSSDRHAITRRDVTVAVAAAGVVFAFMKLVGPLLFQVQP